MQEEIAKADACHRLVPRPMQRLRHDAAYLDADAADEIFNTPPGILAWGAIAPPG